MIRKIKKVADYQFGKNVGDKLFPRDVEITRSKRTNRIRYVYLESERLVTLRPTDGLFSLSIKGAKRIVTNSKSAECLVTIQEEVSEFIRKGRSAFAKHVVNADRNIRPKDEVIVVNQSGKVLAVGRAFLSGKEMITFNTGVAVKIRRGYREEN